VGTPRAEDGRNVKLTVAYNSLPARWADDKIVVNDAVLILPPYGIENLQAPPGKEQSIAHVRKILEAHQRKKPVGNRAPVATPIGPRKGG
jgi:hypothetical protein